MTTDKILCALDFYEASKRALQVASELAKSLGADLELLHVYDIPPLLNVTGSTAVTVADYLEPVMHAAQLALEEQHAALEARGIRATTKLLAGSAAATIAEEASRYGATMIVMGTHGRSGIGHLLLGSVAERVVRTAAMPVLTVRGGR